MVIIITAIIDARNANNAPFNGFEPSESITNFIVDNDVVTISWWWMMQIISL